jgi:hypothetical protein
MLVRKDLSKPSSCGWLPVNSISDTDTAQESQPCDKYIASLKLRRNIGSKDSFNGFGFVDGSPTELSASCDHQFYKSPYSSETGFNNVFGTLVKSELADNVGMEFNKVYYRYTLDSGVVNVRSNTYGWGFMRGNCIDPNSVPKTGTKKTEDTAPGPDPNAK